MWNLMTSTVTDKICGRLDQQQLLPEAWKGCRKRSRGSNDSVYIERAATLKAIPNNLVMA